jgi:oxygen-independent coproporphyrinogen-3 oxidase
MHTAAEAVAAFEIARATFDRVNFDLIYARQDQGLDTWRAELDRALAMAIDHLSLYQLTIEAGTRFGALHARGRLRGLPGAELAADMYAATGEACARAGLAAYEVSNYARPGAESRHNLVYWRYGDYAGIGPGAHGRLSLGPVRWALEAERQPEAWLEGTARTQRVALTPEEQAVEMVMMGLRLREGIDAGRYARLAGRALPSKAVAELQDLGLLAVEGARITATDEGRAVLDAVLKALLVQ